MGVTQNSRVLKQRHNSQRMVFFSPSSHGYGDFDWLLTAFLDWLIVSYDSRILTFHRFISAGQTSFQPAKFSILARNISDSDKNKSRSAFGLAALVKPTNQVKNLCLVKNVL